MREPAVPIRSRVGDVTACGDVSTIRASGESAATTIHDRDLRRSVPRLCQRAPAVHRTLGGVKTPGRSLPLRGRRWERAFGQVLRHVAIVPRRDWGGAWFAHSSTPTSGGRTQAPAYAH